MLSKENFVFGPNKRYHVIRKQPKSQINAKEEIRLAEEDNEGTTLDILKMPLEEFKTLKKEKGTDFIMSSAKKPERVVATIPHLYLIDFGLCRKRPEKEGLRMPVFTFLIFVLTLLTSELYCYYYCQFTIISFNVNNYLYN